VFLSHAFILPSVFLQPVQSHQILLPQCPILSPSGKRKPKPNYSLSLRASLAEGTVDELLPPREVVETGETERVLRGTDEHGIVGMGVVLEVADLAVRLE
jgi:hypothetical protein